jgi:hypothetical protein
MTVPTQGQAILVDQPRPSSTERAPVKPGNVLTGWLVGKFQPWEQHRSDGYDKRWAEYWRLWRGQWLAEDKNRQSERSRIVAPALANAIEMSAAEVSEAVFAKDVWFDISDDIADEDKMDAYVTRDTLRDDLAYVNAQSVVDEAVLNGAIFGTGLIKTNVEVIKVPKAQRNGEGKLYAQMDERVCVYWEAIRPDQFVPDPAGRTIQEMLGCFHKVSKPLNYVLEKIENGVYRKDAATYLTGGTFFGSDVGIDRSDPQARLASNTTDEVEIIEYHGKVPAAMLHAATGERVGRDAEGNLVLQQTGQTAVDHLLMGNDEGAMVEAIVTIANQSVLLRAMVNPFTMQDRAIVAFQWEKVPGRFWGRGVAEKGYNPQKALDSEMRARIDALGFISAPMIAVDGGRVPRGFKMEIKPGKMWITQGPPSDVLMPVQIGAVEPNTFNQTQELERMVEMGTGAFDTSVALRSQGSGAGPSASNVSAMMGAFVKRSKRAVRNVTNNLLEPLIRKTVWRYMQFDPVRYAQDYEFRVMATLGIVAREVESMNLTQLMGMMPEEFPGVSAKVAEGIIDLSSLHNKAQIVAAIQQATAPPSEEQQQKQQEMEQLQFTAVKAEAQGKLLENQKIMAETRKLLAETLAVQKQADQTDAEIALEVQRLRGELEQLDIMREQNQIDLLRVAVERQRVQNEKNRPASNK